MVPCPEQDRGDGCFAPSLVPSLLCHSLPDFVTQSLAPAPGTPSSQLSAQPCGALTSNSSPSPDMTTNVSHCDRSSSRTFSCAWWGLSVGESGEIWSITLHPSALPAATPQTVTPAPDGDPSPIPRDAGGKAVTRQVQHPVGPKAVLMQSQRPLWQGQDPRERRRRRRRSCSWTHQ